MSVSVETLIDRALRYWPALAGLFAASMLAAAHLIERVGGYEPCELCYRQREIYWALLALVAASAFIWARRPESRAARGVEALLAVGFLTSAAVAGFHAGVEWDWWTGPACTGATATFDPSVLDAAMNVNSCDIAPFRILGLSMAGLNAVAALVMAGLCLFAAAGPRDPMETR